MISAPSDLSQSDRAELITEKRAIVCEGNNTTIRHDETERRREKRNRLDISISVHTGGIEIRRDRTYSMEEDRRSPMLRIRMRRIDIHAINFQFGARK